MDEQWTEPLRCPNCRQTGTVSLTLSAHDETPTVNDIADGFTVVETPFGPLFHCAACDMPADP
jgi:hypothetical protein